MMTANQIQTAFKNFGKLVKLANLCRAFANTYKEHLMALNDQMTDSTRDTYDLCRAVVLPTQTSVGRMIVSTESAATRMRSAMESYLVILAPDLPTSPSASAAAKVEALRVAMVAAGQSVEPDSSGSDGFFAYFNTNWGVALPINVAPTCPDTWITTSLL